MISRTSQTFSRKKHRAGIINNKCMLNNTMSGIVSSCKLRSSCLSADYK